MFLDKAFRSIWDDQTRKPGQVVLVQDGSVPSELKSTIDQWQSHLGDFLTLIELPTNVGLGGALSKGLEECRHEMVARMDTDDVAFPERFEVQMSFMEANPKIDVVGSFVEEIDQDGSLMGIRKMPIEHEAIRANLWASPIIHPTVMLRRSRVLAAGNYDPQCRRRQDYELWFRCAEFGLRFHNISRPLLFYRFGADTHKKQPPGLAWEQAMIGFRGASRLGMPVYQRLACFIPFARSLLPRGFQHLLYRVLKPFDPRQKA